MGNLVSLGGHLFPILMQVVPELVKKNQRPVLFLTFSKKVVREVSVPLVQTSFANLLPLYFKKN